MDQKMRKKLIQTDGMNKINAEPPEKVATDFIWLRECNWKSMRQTPSLTKGNFDR